MAKYIDYDYHIDNNTLIAHGYTTYEEEDENEQGELVCNIPHIDTMMHDKRLQSQTFDTIRQAIKFIDESFQQNKNSYVYFSAYAYKLLDNYRITIYYHSHVSNA